MCSGRVDLAFILRAFARGADGVFIGGCRLGECNYVTHGNYHALNLTLLGQKILEHIGLNPQRLQIEFMSGGEGNLFVDVVDAFIKQVKALGPLGESEGLGATELKEKLSQVHGLVPYIKIEKHAKLIARLESEAEYEDHFTLAEIEQLFEEVASYYIDPDKCQACMICSRRCPVDAIDGAKNRIHVIDQDQCIKCGTCLQACPSRFGAVTKIVGGPVPPPLPEEERTILRTGKKTEKRNTSTEKANP
jgi:F420-non-reducing hydrogenase iron-sulfur subunit